MTIARKPNKLRIIIVGADVTIEPLVPGKAGQLKVVEAGRLVAALPLLLKACGEAFKELCAENKNQKLIDLLDAALVAATTTQQKKAARTTEAAPPVTALSFDELLNEASDGVKRFRPHGGSPFNRPCLMGPPHPVDGGDYAPIAVLQNPADAELLCRLWNLGPSVVDALRLLMADVRKISGYWSEGVDNSMQSAEAELAKLDGDVRATRMN